MHFILSSEEVNRIVESFKNTGYNTITEFQILLGCYRLAHLYCNCILLSRNSDTFCHTKNSVFTLD